MAKNRDRNQEGGQQPPDPAQPDQGQGQPPAEGDQEQNETGTLPDGAPDGMSEAGQPPAPPEEEPGATAFDAAPPPPPPPAARRPQPRKGGRIYRIRAEPPVRDREVAGIYGIKVYFDHEGLGETDNEEVRNHFLKVPGYHDAV
jgi:hypothetical protein